MDRKRACDEACGLKNTGGVVCRRAYRSRKSKVTQPAINHSIVQLFEVFTQLYDHVVMLCVRYRKDLFRSNNLMRCVD